MARFDLTDAAWAGIELVLPTGTRGVERVDLVKKPRSEKPKSLGW